MQTPPLPDNEAQRLEALRSYAVLDGPKEAGIDALAHVAQQVCGTPFALVSLLDADRQWFLSSIGLNVTSTTREVAFCSHTILRPSEVLHICDTRLDERVCDNPFVVGEPGLRFYAGAPLVDRSGFALGTLCVLDIVPRQLTDTQIDVLRALSQAVVKLIEARRTENAHHAAQRHNALLQIAEDMAELGHFRLDICEGRALWSHHVLDMLGWPEDKPLTYGDFIHAQHPADRPAMEEAWRKALSDGTPFDIESRVLRGDRELRYVHVKARCELDATSGRACVVFGMLQDITERTHMRERALHQSRLAATGTLAAGVGHEINNPLTYLSGNIELAIDRLQRGLADTGSIPELVAMLQEANDGATRIRDIVRGLRTFAHSEEALHPTDVRVALNTALSMAKHELRHRATLHDQVGDVPAVQANEARLSQVLLNLLVNAAQSFSTNDPTRNHVTVRASASEREVVVEIEDNGSGIPAELQSRIFDPFFTTKQLGEGTGLGLSISHNLVRSLQGAIRCVSEPGRGTTFRVTLPIARQRPAEQPVLPREPNTVSPSARVLVIDDEPAIARSMQQMLREHNQVTTYTDPREACEWLLRHPGDFEVVFCDLMMPFMTGMELYRRVTAAYPELARRFVFMTGASIDEQVARFLDTARNPPLEKPFALEPLTHVVRSIAAAR